MATSGAEMPSGGRLRPPEQCVLWREPELVGLQPAERFELVETIADSSHASRAVLRCRECGQLYLYDFREEVDWEKGDDPQSTTYVPLRGPEDIERLRGASSLELMACSPRLERDFPKGAKEASVRWVGK